MAREDVQRALRAMDGDEVIRLRLADGDFSAVDGMTLTEEEQLLVRDAANDMPEVAGFGVDNLLGSGIKGESTDKDHKGEIEIASWSLGVQSSKWQMAVKYAFR